jgi:dipeptidyl aminopeptidase/acylaminoacyl peptidase
VEDGAAAVAWVVAHAAEHGWDGDGLYLAGHSAGAHIAALLAADARYLEAAGVSRSVVDAFVGLSGPYDFLPLGEGYLREVFPEALRERSQPINFVDEAMAPSLLLHGGDDEVVEPGNSERLAARLRGAGVPVDLVLYPDVGHAAVAAALLPGLSYLADTEGDVLEFLERREEERLANPRPNR